MTAKQAYAESVRRAKRACWHIERAIEKHTREAHDDPDNWGQAGHMGAVCEALEAALATLEGTE